MQTKPAKRNIGFSEMFIRNPLRYLRMNGARCALFILPAKRTAKNSAVKSIELLRILKFYCLYSAPHYAQIKKTE